MANKRVVQGALIPVGFQAISLSNSTSVAVNSTARGSGNVARVLDISVETNHARFRADGSNPTLSTGVLLNKDVTYRLTGYNGTASLRFQRSTGTAKVSIQSYKYAGD